MITFRVEKVETWKTSDGKLFDNEKDAIEHQEDIEFKEMFEHSMLVDDFIDFRAWFKDKASDIERFARIFKGREQEKAYTR